MITLLFSGNVKAFDGTITSALSITERCKEPIRAYYLTMDLHEENADYLPLTKKQIDVLDEIYKSANKKSSARIIDCTKLYKTHLYDSVNSKNRYTPYAMLRLFIPKITEINDKALYLDTDVIALSDVSELWNVDVDAYEFAAVNDYLGNFFIGKNYVNSGVLLVNVKKVRETGLFDKALNACRTYKMAFPDQTALNTLADTVKRLPRRYNEQKKEMPDTVIRHFTKTLVLFPLPHPRNVKPWQIDKMHKILKNHIHDGVLDKYLKIKTDYENAAEKENNI